MEGEARPHPSPLPQERGWRRRVLFARTASLQIQRLEGSGVQSANYWFEEIAPLIPLALRVGVRQDAFGKGYWLLAFSGAPHPNPLPFRRGEGEGVVEPLNSMVFGANPANLAPDRDRLKAGLRT